MKTCKNIDCKEQNPQPLENFGKNLAYKDGKQRHCKKCVTRKTRIWQIANPEKAREINISWRTENPEKQEAISKGQHLKKFWPGLNALEAFNKYTDMLVKQNGVCKICSNHETATRDGKIRELCVDHCHKTGRVRGLLCNDCNQALGRLKDNIDLFYKAITYLDDNNSIVESLD